MRCGNSLSSLSLASSYSGGISLFKWQIEIMLGQMAQLCNMKHAQFVDVPKVDHMTYTIQEIYSNS